MELLDRFPDVKMDSGSLDHLHDTLCEYKKYLELLKLLEPREREAFLRYLKKEELVNNQEMEHEDAFMVEMYGELGMKNSIDTVVKNVTTDTPLSLEQICKLHKVLIHGTQDDIDRNIRYRDFETTVAKVNDGREEICYIPPSPDKIQGYMEKIIAYLNTKYTGEEMDILLRPILGHAYTAALQPFGNGNTRLSRLLEYAGIFRLTRDSGIADLNLPALYLSKNYLLTRGQYRGKIESLVNNPVDEEWNRWVNYNLNMADEQLYFCNQRVESLLARRR